MPPWFAEEHKTRAIHCRQQDYPTLKKALTELKKLLEEGCNERKFNARLKKTPDLFNGWHRTGHQNYAWPEAFLGNQGRPDWLLMTGDSGGGLYTAIELKKPQCSPFNQDGSYSPPTDDGIQQIKDRRIWLETNLGYARKPKAENGLGLHDITPALPDAVVVVGRREKYHDIYVAREKFNGRRRHTYGRESIKIISYDNFLERLADGLRSPPTKDSFLKTLEVAGKLKKSTN